MLVRKRHRLAERRKDVGLSQERLAELVGVDRSTVVRWERAETDPQPWFRPRLARALNVSVDELARLLADVSERAPGSRHVTGLPPGLTASGASDDLAAVESLRKTDRQVGGGYLYATVTGYLQRNVAPRLFGHVAQDDDRPTFLAAAGLTEMAGWMAHDAGRDCLAEQHFRRALSLAQVGQDHQLVAHVYGSLSHLAHHMHRPQLAIDYASRGRVHLAAGKRHHGVEARLLALEARGHAAERDYERCISMLRQAECALAEEPSDSPSPWVSVFDEASMAAEAARCLYALGQPGAARQYAEQVVKLRSEERTRSRALARLTLISALIAQGHTDEACCVAREVLNSTRGLGSYVVVRQLEQLKQSLARYRHNPDVATFLDDLGEELRERQWLVHWIPPADARTGAT